MDMKNINEVNGRINHKVWGFGQTGLLTLFNNNTYVVSYLNTFSFFLFFLQNVIFMINLVRLVLLWYDFKKDRVEQQDKKNPEY